MPTAAQCPKADHWLPGDNDKGTGGTDYTRKKGELPE